MVMRLAVVGSLQDLLGDVMATINIDRSKQIALDCGYLQPSKFRHPSQFEAGNDKKLAFPHH